VEWTSIDNRVLFSAPLQCWLARPEGSVPPSG
jgi:hypothetical protein